MNFITHHSLAKTQCEETESSLVDIATFEEENISNLTKQIGFGVKMSKTFSTIVSFKDGYPFDIKNHHLSSFNYDIKIRFPIQ